MSIVALFLVQWGRDWGTLEMKVIVNAVIAAVVVAVVTVGLDWVRNKQNSIDIEKEHLIDPSRIDAANVKNSPNIYASGNVRIGHVGDVINVPANTSLQAAQILEIQKLNGFLGGKDELALRELFDFHNILKFNILLAKRSMNRSYVSTEQSKAVDDYFVGGQAVLDTRFNRVIRTPEGLIRSEFLPNTIGLVNASKKYTENKKMLLEFETSPNMPSTVRIAVKELDEAVGENIVKFLFVVNEAWKENPKRVIDDDRQSSPFFFSTTNLYWERFDNPCFPIAASDARKKCADMVARDNLFAMQPWFPQSRAF
jgi:hypothetical protein